MRLPKLIDRLDPREGLDRFQPISYTLREKILAALGVRDFQYLPEEIALRRAFRRIFPVPTSPWTNQPVEDKSVINLVPPEKLRPFFGNLIEILREARGDNEGDYLEFGVFNGSSMSCMIKASQDQNADQMRFFGFDGFKGLPPKAANEDGGVWGAGDFKCSFEEMQVSMRKKGTDPNDVEWIVGWYEETLTPETAEAHNFDLGIVMVDCDAYSSAKTVLDFIGPLIEKPIIICFDDWKLNDVDIKEMGEYQAFNEFLVDNPDLRARELRSYNRKSKTFLITKNS